MNALKKLFRRKKKQQFRRKNQPPRKKFPPPKPSWKHLFAFTTQHDSATLSFSLLTCLATSGLKAFLPIVYGFIFDAISEFGSGSVEGGEFLRVVAKWAVVLVGMGVGTWIANGSNMGAWIQFGERQARTVRKEVFKSLLVKDMAWYDSQADGISSLLTRIESYIVPFSPVVIRW